jgi:hypothetical protein
MEMIKYPLYINSNDVVKIIEPAAPQCGASNAKVKTATPQRQKQKPADQNQRLQETSNHI